MSLGPGDTGGACSALLTPSASVSPVSPVPRIKWRKVDGSLSPQWTTAEPTLQIPSVSFEDEGTYECEAENSKGRDTVQGRIIVQGTETPPSSLRKIQHKIQHKETGRASCSSLQTLARPTKHVWRGHLRAQQGPNEKHTSLSKDLVAKAAAGTAIECQLPCPHCFVLSSPEYQQRPLLSLTNTAAL